MGHPPNPTNQNTRIKVKKDELTKPEYKHK